MLWDQARQDPIGSDPIKSDQKNVDHFGFFGGDAEQIRLIGMILNQMEAKRLGLDPAVYDQSDPTPIKSKRWRNVREINHFGPSQKKVGTLLQFMHTVSMSHNRLSGRGLCKSFCAIEYSFGWDQALDKHILYCGISAWTLQTASQRSLHNEPIFRLLLKVAVKGTQQCEFLNFCGVYSPILTLAPSDTQHGGLSASVC